MGRCYRKANSTLISDTTNVDRACSLITTSQPFSSCCLKNEVSGGTGNLCLSDYLCWAGTTVAGATGFLTASCTDETYASGECTQHCTDNPVCDIVYNPDTNLWACCSWSYAGGVDCKNPTNETWRAPAPHVLLNAASSSSSIIGTALLSTASSTSAPAPTTNTSSSTITSTNSSATSSASSTSSSSSGLGTGAKAGISVGVVLGILFLALAFFLVWQQRRKSRQRHAGGQSVDNAPAYEKEAGRKSWDVGASKYRDYSRAPVEMHSNSTYELPINEPMGGGRSRVIEMP